jgi:V/A-type H+-transporting ATPase subunit I
MALVFPFFFGLMIGDLAYGILLATAGVFFMTKLKKYEGFRELGVYILIAGIIAALFGAFVFGDAFGIPFHAPHEAHGAEAISWSGILGTEVPLKASVHKLEASGLGNLLLFSILAAVVHLSLGNLFGIVNEWPHNRRHAAAKAGWLFSVLGFGFLILKFGEGTSLGRWLWDSVLWPFAPSLDPGIGILIPYASIVFLLAGIVLVVAGEGAIALAEIMGVFSNILSYTRLGAIGVAKGAMAFAFNILIIPMITGGNIGFAIMGCVFLVLAHMLVFMLGSLSSGIQALRLNLVEYFMKFFKGGGIKFIPFGKEKYDWEKSSGA